MKIALTPLRKKVFAFRLNLQLLVFTWQCEEMFHLTAEEASPMIWLTQFCKFTVSKSKDIPFNVASN